MKTKRFMILCLLLCSVTMFSQTIQPILTVEGGYKNLDYTTSSERKVNLRPIFEVEGGYKDATYHTFSVYSSNRVNMKGYNMWSNIIIGLQYKNFKVIEQTENYFGYEEGYSFSPKQVAYTVTLSYEIKRFTFYYEHMCTHSIIYELDDDKAIRFNGSWDKLSLKFKIL